MSIERKFTRPRYREATRSIASCVGRQSAPLVNQNEITSGRSNRSQTRIAPGASISQAGSRRASAGQGFSEVEQSSWSMFASLSRGPVRASGTANSGNAMPRSSPPVPSVPPPSVRMVFRVATTISTKKAIPTKVE